MCCFIGSSRSIRTPRSRMMVDGWMMESPIWMEQSQVVSFARLDFNSTQIASVLLAFGWRQRDVHHEMMSRVQHDKRFRSMSVSSGRQLLLNWVSYVGVKMQLYCMTLQQINDVLSTWYEAAWVQNWALYISRHLRLTLNVTIKESDLLLQVFCLQKCEHWTQLIFARLSCWN